MPFDEDEKDSDNPLNKKGLKKVSSQLSIFDAMPKKPSQEEFEKRVQNMQERNSGYKAKVADLTAKYKKILFDKTLKQNKNVFAVELERDILAQMVNLAIDINHDPDEGEGMGSMAWTTVLLAVCLSQRDRINQLEHHASLLEKKCDPYAISVLISKELQALDKKKSSE